jgi:4'-phosphopantetheinyl transferase
MNISDAAFQPDTQIVVLENEVHLWHIDLAAVAQAERRWQQLLSSDEQARAKRFHFSQDRQYFTAARALLRTILASYLDSKPKELIFRYSDKRKPSVSPDLSKTPLEFNVSHSGAVALLAFARGRALGVDVEQVRNNFDHTAIAHRFFSLDEQRQLVALAPEERYRGFFRCWTRKEAYIKAQGAGLSLPLHQFDVSLKPGDDDALLSTRPDSAEAARWCLQEVPAADG